MASRIATAGLLALAGWCIYTIIEDSGMPSRYFRPPERFVYPTHDVIVWTCAVAVEALVAAGLLWRARSVPVTCAVLALVFALGAAVLVPMSMHARPYWIGHVAFLILAVAWFVVAGLATWLVRWRKRRAAC